MLPALPVFTLLIGTLVWGTIWFPFRALAAAGFGALTASFISYALALLIAVATYGRLAWVRPNLELCVLCLSAGITNVGFIWATNHGLILRVLLLFYLMPVWSVVFAWVLLAVRPDRHALALLALALCGAAVMLWRPALGLPVPANAAEWAALVAGMCFALSNVLVRRAERYDARCKSVWIIAGCTVLGGIGALFEAPGLPTHDLFAPLCLLVVLGVVLFAVNLVVQYGVERVSPARVPVIYLFELVIAAGSAWLLAGEAVHLREAIGGALIIAATLLPAPARA